MIDSVFKEITKGRTLINLSDSKILIQDNLNILVDLEESAFQYDNKI